MNYSISFMTLAATICVAHTTAQLTPFPTQSPPLPSTAGEEKESMINEMEALKHNMEDILEEETILEYEIEEGLNPENDITGDDMEPFLEEEEGFVDPNVEVETETETKKKHGRKKKGKDGLSQNTTNTSDVDSDKKRGGNKKKHKGSPNHTNSTEVDTSTKKKKNRLGGHKKKHENIEEARAAHHKKKMKKMEHEMDDIGTPTYFEESDPIETSTPSNHGSKAEKGTPQPDDMDSMESQSEEYYDAEEEKRLRRKKVTDAEAVAYMNGKARKLLSLHGWGLEEESP